MTPTKRYTPAQIIEAIESSRGILTVAAKTLKCSRQTIYTYMKRYATVKKAYDESNEEMLDFAEQQLIKNIADQKEASIFFYLKTKGKKRGYIERPAPSVNIDVKSLTNRQLERLANGEDLVTVLADKSES